MICFFFLMKNFWFGGCFLILLLEMSYRCLPINLKSGVIYFRLQGSSLRNHRSRLPSLNWISRQVHCLRFFHLWSLSQIIAESLPFTYRRYLKTRRPCHDSDISAKFELKQLKFLIWISCQVRCCSLFLDKAREGRKYDRRHSATDLVLVLVRKDE